MAPDELFDTPVKRGASPVPGHVQRAVSYMRLHLEQTITMRDLARACGASESTLRKNFTRFIGHPPLAHLRRLRFAAARDELLRFPDRAVGSVAQRLGFAHLGRFSADYRRLFGERPSETRDRAELAIKSGLASHDAIEQAPYPSRVAPSVRIIRFQVNAASRHVREFADDLAERLAGVLCRVGPLTVKLSPVARYDDGRRDDSRYLMTGKVTETLGQLRVIVRLVEVATDIHLWGDSFDGLSNAAMALQDRIAEAVSHATWPSILRREIDHARTRCSEALSAYDLALRALPLAMAGDRGQEAVEMLERAMDLDPDYALPPALAAWCHARFVNPWNARATEHRDAAIRLAVRAVALDSRDPLVLTARASVLTMAGELGRSDDLLVRALAIDPACSWAWERRGWLRVFSRSFAEAIGDFDRALRFKEPFGDGASSLFGIGTTHWCAGRIAEAVPWIHQAVIERPSAPGIQAQLAGCYLRLGERSAARRTLAEMRRDRPDATVTRLLRSFWFDKPCPTVANDLVEIGMPP